MSDMPDQSAAAGSDRKDGLVPEGDSEAGSLPLRKFFWSLVPPAWGLALLVVAGGLSGVVPGPICVSMWLAASTVTATACFFDLGNSDTASQSVGTHCLLLTCLCQSGMAACMLAGDLGSAKHLVVAASAVGVLGGVAGLILDRHRHRAVAALMMTVMPLGIGWLKQSVARSSFHEQASQLACAATQRAVTYELLGCACVGTCTPTTPWFEMLAASCAKRQPNQTCGFEFTPSGLISMQGLVFQREEGSDDGLRNQIEESGGIVACKVHGMLWTRESDRPR